jgi:hypothetical protein
VRLSLSEADRARFGAPEFLPIDLSTLTNREAVALQGLGFTPRSLNRRLKAKELEDGDFELDYAAWDALLWLALRRAGVEVDVHTVEYDVYGLRMLADEEVVPLPAEPEDPGKAEAPEASTS